MIKIQFGSGINILNGWINTDLPAVDVTKTLPYKNNYADFLFHEHVIEHLDEVDGLNFLKECYRVLKPGGKLRISCPVIDGFFYVYQNWDDMIKKYPKLLTFASTKTRFINSCIIGQAVGFSAKTYDSNNNIVIIKNNMAWHKYYYDKEDFIDKLTQIGFKNIEFFNKSESNTPELKNLERRTAKTKEVFDGYPPEMELNLEVTK